MHDLLRAYARERAEADDSAAERQAALERLLDHYLYAAAAAMDVLFPAERQRRPVVSAPGTPVPQVAAPEAARAWLDAERPGLVAAAGYAAGAGWPGHAVRLAAVVFRYLERAGHYPEITAIGGHALRTARRAGDHGAEAEALLNLTVVDLRQGRYRRGAAQMEQALVLYREAEDRTGQARALGNLGIAAFSQGSYDRAAGCHGQALALYRQAGDSTGESRTLNNLALIDLRQGRCQHAASRLEQVLAINRQTGDQSGEAETRNELGQLSLTAGRLGNARAQHAAALDLATEIHDTYEQARDLYTALGAPEPGHISTELDQLSP
jgi:tetratricopeptide (TPR) repeat protein